MASETDMWLESQIYGPQKQICGTRVRYMALRNIDSDISSQKQICGWSARYMALRNRYVAGDRYMASETDMWLESQI